MYSPSVRKKPNQIVPIDDAAKLAVIIVPNGTLKIYEGAPHGMTATHKDKVNADLLAFCRNEQIGQAAA